MKTVKNPSTEIDPLFVIFEQHLFEFNDSQEDRKTFIDTVVSDYLSFLRRKNIAIPKTLESSIIEELGTQVNAMLVKKIYGCLQISDYVKKQPATLKKRAKARYRKLAS